MTTQSRLFLLLSLGAVVPLWAIVIEPTVARRQALDLVKAASIYTLGGVVSPAQAQIEEQAVDLSAKFPKEMIDEVGLKFDQGVGIELTMTSFARTTLGAVPSNRIAVKRVVQGSRAEALGVRPGWILVSANEQSLENVSADAAARIISEADRPLRLVFRDFEAFPNALRPGSGIDAASTRVLSDYNGEPQILGVERILKPQVCTEGAQVGDLLEVRFEGRLADGKLFDGSAITFADGSSVPGRAGDSSLYFVLGAQPAGQFPIAWDPAMYGACVGEIRSVQVPPVLGFQDKGSKRRGVPPFAYIYYTLQLLSINGIALPQ